jgi:hypothetical protein
MPPWNESKQAVQIDTTTPSPAVEEHTPSPDVAELTPTDRIPDMYVLGAIDA